jgi:ketosteroid isomerase-like protein
MSAESTAPDLVELMRRSVEAANRRDFDAMASFYALDAVWDMSPLGLGVYEGRAAIRRFFEDWFDSYEEWAMEIETIFDLGSGVVYGVNDQQARLAGSSGTVRFRDAFVCLAVDGLFVRFTRYPNIDEARAAAERLVESKG